jgi:hypothetical protein
MTHQEAIADAAYSPDGRSILTGRFDRTERPWKVPGAIAGEPRCLTLWIEVITGIELDNETNVTRVLDAKTWEDRRRQLTEMGGPPCRTPQTASRRSP